MNEQMATEAAAAKAAKKFKWVIRTANQYFGIGDTLADAVRNALKAGTTKRDKAMVNLVEYEAGQADPTVDGMGNLNYHGEQHRVFAEPRSLGKLLLGGAGAQLPHHGKDYGTAAFKKGLRF